MVSASGGMDAPDGDALSDDITRLLLAGYSKVYHAIISSLKRVVEGIMISHVRSSSAG